MASGDRVEVPGSTREVNRAHARLGDVDQQAEIEVSVYLRAAGSLDWLDQEAGRAPSERRRLSREDWAQVHGADTADIDAVKSFAADAGLPVGSVDASRRVVRLRGTVHAIACAFGAHMVGLFEPASGAGRYRAREGSLSVPAQLEGIVAGVFGLDDRPQARPHLRVAAHAETSSYTPVEVAQAYAFPTAASGKGETVGILEMGGGYSTADLATYFQSLGLANPQVTAISVDGGTNAPGKDNDADGEVMLDIEVVGAVANDAAIAVYFAPNTDQGFIDALSTAVHDTTHKPSVISISWGQSEDSWSEQARTQMEQIFTEAAGLGVTVTVAAGDNGIAVGLAGLPTWRRNSLHDAGSRVVRSE